MSRVASKKGVPKMPHLDNRGLLPYREEDAPTANLGSPLYPGTPVRTLDSGNTPRFHLGTHPAHPNPD